MQLPQPAFFLQKRVEPISSAMRFLGNEKSALRVGKSQALLLWEQGSPARSVGKQKKAPICASLGLPAAKGAAWQARAGRRGFSGSASSFWRAGSELQFWEICPQDFFCTGPSLRAFHRAELAEAYAMTEPASRETESFGRACDAEA